MHPIEQLRFVARAAGADAGLLVAEAASALTVFGSDRAALLVASKRLLSRQPAVGPLWWLAARLAVASDVRGEIRAVLDELDTDGTPRHLAHGLTDGATVAIAGNPSQIVDGLSRRGDVSVLVLDVEGQANGAVRRLERCEVEAESVEGGRVAGVVADADLVLVEAGAAGDGAALVDVGSAGLVATARTLGTPVWLVCGVGRRLAEQYWQELIMRVTDLDLPPWLQDHETVGYGQIDRVVTPSGSVVTSDWNAGTIPFAPELLGPAL